MSIQLVSGNSNWNANPGDFAKTFAAFSHEKDALAFMGQAFRNGMLDEAIIADLLSISLDRGYYRAFSFLLSQCSPIAGLKMINKSEICRKLIDSQGVPLELCKQLDGLGWDPSYFNQKDAFGVTLIQKLSRSGRGESQFFRSLVERVGIRNIQLSANFGQEELERCLNPNGMRELSAHKFSGRIPEITQHGCTVRIHPKILIQGVPVDSVVGYVSGKSISEPLSSPNDIHHDSQKQDKTAAPKHDFLLRTTLEPLQTSISETGSKLDVPGLQDRRGTLPRFAPPDFARSANMTFGADEPAGSDLDAHRLQDGRGTLSRFAPPDFARSANVTFGANEQTGSDLEAVQTREPGRYQMLLVSLNDTTYADKDTSGSELQLKEEPRRSSTFSGTFEYPIPLPKHLSATTYLTKPSPPEAQNQIVLRSPTIQMNGSSESYNRSHVWLRIHLAPGHGMLKVQDPRDGQFKSYGFYPIDRNQPLIDLLLGVPCRIQDDEDYIDAARNFNADLASQTLITAEQGIKVLKHIEQTQKDCETGRRQFHLLGNCVNFVQEIYSEAEIPGPTHFGQSFPPSDFSRHLHLQQSPIAMQYAMLHAYGLLPAIAAHAMSSNALAEMDRPLQMIGQTPHSLFVGGVAL